MESYCFCFILKIHNVLEHNIIGIFKSLLFLLPAEL